jgi:hypothetical protein
MKSSLLLGILTLIVLFGIIGCRKNLINEELHPGQRPADANVTAAKKWYNESFKKSAEWASYNSAGKRITGETNDKKEPDWEHGISNKLGNLEIMEFPFLKSNTTFSLPSTSLTDEEKIKLAKASLSRIAFIKNDRNEMTVREIDYIPDWQYLQKKNFDISNAMYGKPADDFTGRILVKNWNEDILSLRMIENGKIIKKGSIKKSDDNRLLRLAPGGGGECQPMQVCVWRQTCVQWSTSTGFSYETCGAWYNTGNCWIENYCTGGTTGSTDCYPAPAPASERIDGSTTNETTGTTTGTTTEPCPCEFYGTCDACNMTEEQAQGKLDELVNSGSTLSDACAVTLISSTDTNRVKEYCWKFFGTTGSIWYFTSYEKGVHYKTNNTEPSTQWAWRSLEHKSISRQGVVAGGSVECTLNTANSTLGTYSAGMVLNYNMRFSLVCTGFPFSYGDSYQSVHYWSVNE